jgi:hypothetical protein
MDRLAIGSKGKGEAVANTFTSYQYLIHITISATVLCNFID